MADYNRSWWDEIRDKGAEVLAAAKQYAEGKASEALSNAKSYTRTFANNGDTETLQAANTHADNGDAQTLSSANSYADAGDNQTLNSAKSYADSGDTQTLTGAKGYADSKDSQTLSSANSFAQSRASEAQTNAINYAQSHGVGTRYGYIEELGSRFFYFTPTSTPSGYPFSYKYGAGLAIGHGYSGNNAEIIITHTDPSGLAFRASQTYPWQRVYHEGNFTPPEDRYSGALGSYMTAITSGAVQDETYRFGDTISGIYLKPTASASFTAAESSVSGTWRCMGHVKPSPNLTSRVSLWLRIA